MYSSSRLVTLGLLSLELPLGDELVGHLCKYWDTLYATNGNRRALVPYDSKSLIKLVQELPRIWMIKGLSWRRPDWA